MIIKDLLLHFRNYPYVIIQGDVDFSGAVRLDDNGWHLMAREHPKSTIWIDYSEHLMLTVKGWSVSPDDKVVIEV